MPSDYEVLLDLNRCFVAEEKQDGQTTDKVIALVWKDVPNTQAKRAADWERANRISITDLKTEYKVYAGTWRSVGVETTRASSSGANIVHRFAYGYATALTWTEARLFSGRSAKAHDQAVTGTSGTTSDNPGKHYVVRFPNINPFKLNTVLATVSDSYTDPVVNTETLTGAWNVLFATAGKQEDGAGYIDVVLSLDKYTLALYEYYNTINQALVYRLYNVPRDDAQSIIDAWKTTDGRSASADFSDERQTVTLTLRDRGSPKDNTTITWIKSACDSYFQQHLAWGYTKAEIKAWAEGISTNDLATRTLSIQDRGDGLFNGVMEERKWVNASPTEPGFTITVPIGQKITRQQDYGWNYKSSEITAAAIKERYDESANDVGKRVDFRVTRDENCMFDYEAVITSQSAAIDGDIDTEGAKGTGIRVLSRSVKGATTAEITTIEGELDLEGGKRKRVEVDIDMREDELADIKARVTEVRATEGSKVIGDRTVYFGKNADAVLADDLEGVVLMGASAGPGDDGSIDYSITVKPLMTLEKTITDGNTDVEIGINLDTVPDAPSKDVLRSAEASEGDNGKWNFRMVSEALQSLEQTVTDGHTDVNVGINATSVPTAGTKDVLRSASAAQGDAGKWNYQIASEDLQSDTDYKESTTIKGKRYVQTGINQDDSTTPTGAVLVSASFSPGDAGKWNYQLVSEDIDETTGTVTDSGNGVSEDVSAGINSDRLPTIASDRLTQDRVSIQPTEHGKYNWQRRTTTVQESSKDLNMGSAGEMVVEHTGYNKNPAAVSFTSPTAKGKSLRLNFVAYDDAGNMHYRVSESTQTKQEATVSGGTLGVATKTTIARGDTGTLPTETPSQGVSYDISVQVDETGAATWRKIKETTTPLDTGEIQLARLKPGWTEGGYTETGRVFKYNKELPAYGDYGRFEELVIHDDGTYSGRLVTIVYDEEEFFEGFVANAAQYYQHDVHYAWLNTDATHKAYFRLRIDHYVKEAFFMKYSDAQDFCVGGMLNGSGIEVMSIGGKRLWLARKVSPPQANTVEPWTRISAEVEIV